MGKRHEAAKPAVSGKTWSIIEQARARCNKPAPSPSPKPVATPTRSETRVPGVAATEPSTPANPPARCQVTPMSTLTTPVKSPDLKRLKAASPSTSEVPSLPSFKSAESNEHPRHSDSATTLSLTEYYMNKMNTKGHHYFCMVAAGFNRFTLI